MSSVTAAAAAAGVQRSVEAFEAEKQGLESDNAALRKALHSLEVSHLQQRREVMIAGQQLLWNDDCIEQSDSFIASCCNCNSNERTCRRIPDVCTA
jgi:hypothetical protein